MNMQCRRGMSRVDTLAATICIVIIVTISFGAFGVQDGNKRWPRGLSATSHKDAAQLKETHKAMTVFSRMNEGRFPTPGLIDRMPDPELGEVPGYGDEDHSANTTDNIYSCMIAQNYSTPGMVVSPVERNPKVSVYKEYNMETYRPAEGSYWDKSFVADLAVKSNASYAHTPLHGERGKTKWRDTQDSKWIIISNRGPKVERFSQKSYTTSPHGLWHGTVVYSDNHVEFEMEMQKESITCLNNDNEQVPDVFFKDQTSMDIFLTFTKSISKDNFTPQFD